MRLSRRTALQLLSAVPLAASSACRCTTEYLKRSGKIAASPPKLTPFPSAAPPTSAAAVTRGPFIDVHAHFFNASDVPVRGFIAESVAHSRPQAIQELLKAVSPLADRIAAAAPSAADELKELRRLSGEGAAISTGDVQNARGKEDDEAAKRLAKELEGSDFQRMYRVMQRSGQSAAPSASRSGPLSDGEILEIVRASERPASPGAEAAPTPAKSGQAAMADGVVSFLKYMVSPRWTNLQAYLNTFTTGRGAIGIDAVLGVLVDFDYWLDCPPRSTQGDQVKLHQRLYDLYAKSSPLGGAYFHPVVAYNPWTDIEQDGEALRRVIDACTNRHFIAAKIYPPTGFQPAGNAAIAEGKLTKRHPSTKDLDTRLENFFNACADKNIPVLAHAAPSNGRDDFHDGFSGPTEWETLLAQQAAKARVPRVDLGHFGGGRRNWTQEFACLISRFPTMSLYGDLGYWDELMCGSREPEVCETARHQLEEAMKIAIPGTADTVLDRVMFATDWLMLSQVKGWADYPRRVRDQLRQIPGMGDAQLAKVLGGNALKCFPGLRPSRSEEVGDGE